MTIYTMENEAFRAFVKYGGVLMMKLIVMVPLTGFYRSKYKSVMCEEDAAIVTGNDKDKMKKLMEKNPEVERVRAAHLNDLENIIPFFLIAMQYLAIGPDPATAVFVFKTFTFCRIAYTIAYVGKVRQPARGLSFIGGLIVNVYMTVEVLRATWF